MLRLVFLVILIFCNCTFAITKDQLYPFGIQDDQLEKIDDTSSPEVQVSIPIVFYENVYKSIFINDNGILSFITEVPSFFNAQFPLTYPIIAPMYSDVDVRGNGTIYYRETKSEELLQRATQDIIRHFSGASHFRAQSLFIATWNEVGRYNSQKSPVNTVQVVIASSGNESFVVFLYPQNGIQWIQGDGKISNLPDARTQVGFMSGDGRVYTLAGSGTDQIRNFDRMSNVNRPGIWMFQIGNTGPGNIKLPDIDGDRSLAPVGTESCANTQLPCPPTANCIDHGTGFCCVCSDQYFGNGRNCLINNAPLRVNGKVNGIINEIRIENADFHSYIDTKEGRQYTAISRIPQNIGHDMQVLSSIGGIIGWQFASARPETPNGFMLTGGVFNYTSEINFPQTGHHMSIFANFLGPDVFNFLKVQFELRGSLPTVPNGYKVEIEDFEEVYTRAARGQIRSHLTRTFSYGENSLKIPLIIDQTISFEECPHAPFNEELSTLKLKVARNYIVYDSRDQIVRYATTSKVALLSTTDPCREGRSKCGEHSSCVVDGDSFKCICDRGYEHQYREMSSSETIVCGDINECALGRDNCHSFADCVNLPGSFTCRCKPGYFGNGITCQKEMGCEDLSCGPDAECVHLPKRNPECKCKAGFSGDGYVCTRSSVQEDCRVQNICDENADCIGNPKTERFNCFCKSGFRGNGIVCTKLVDSCDLADNCAQDAVCVFDDNQNDYVCICNPGYAGDGYTCVAEGSSSSCNILNNCHPYAQCLFDSNAGTHRCQCNPGYAGDGIRCTRSDVSCSSAPDVCSSLADCVFDEALQKDICKCKEGYHGNGIICQPIDECNADADSCDRNAKCAYNRTSSRYECVCNEGFAGSGKTCAPKTQMSCHQANICNPNATCVLDLQTQAYKCQCNLGYTGDGFKCVREILSCNIINNCDVKAECKYSFDAQAYRCQCINGFVGDGFICRPLITCREDPGSCDRNAECLYSDSIRNYMCHCRAGFVGDGFYCSAAPRFDGNYLIFSQGMSLLRLPFQPNSKDNGQLILTQPRQIPVGLDVDCLKGQIYWTDVAHKTINRARYNGSGFENIIQNLGSPEGIAIDWTSRNIYWTDSVNDVIKVSRLDGTMHKTLVRDDLTDPRGIVIHPGIGKMFWSDWNRLAPKIEIANMDGSGRAVFVVNDIGLPNNLAIDYEHNDLCWTDAGLRRIECINLHGHSRRVIYSPAAYPFDLTVAGDFIYWTDWDIKFIQRIHRNGGAVDPLELPLGGNGKVYSIVTVPHHCPRVTSHCSVSNGGCKHICLPNGRGRTCACPDKTDASAECNDIN